jgi:DNA-binding NarL/FixJ family response regulator
LAIRVSVVEDDDKIRESLVVLIDGSTGFRCVSAYPDAEDAIQDIPRKKPDVVLMDIGLPRMSGVECVRLLKAAEPDIQIIMLTVYEDDNKIFSSVEAGATGYLLKTTPPDQLMNAIREVHAGGSPMSSQIARKVLQSFFKVRRDDVDEINLTAREREVLDLLAKGFLYKEIGDTLHVAVDTVHSHLRRIYEKLHVRSRTEAVVKYLQR